MLFGMMLRNVEMVKWLSGMFISVGIKFVIKKGIVGIRWIRKSIDYWFLLMLFLIFFIVFLDFFILVVSCLLRF